MESDMEERKEELKPCPFCGSAAKLEEENDLHTLDLGCSVLECPAYLLFFAVPRKHKTGFISAWNRRPPPPTL